MKYITSEQIHNGKGFLTENTVIVIGDDGRILDLAPANTIDPALVQTFEGILCPGFVNAHCHLELSHMLNRIPQQTGMVGFALEIIQTRNQCTEEEIKAFAKEADKTMYEQGIVAVGDICNTDHTLDVKVNSPIYYHSFVELLSLNPERAAIVFEEGKKLMARYHASRLHASLAPHAPYTVSPELMRLIAEQAAITTIHNQEFAGENDFFRYKQGSVLQLYEALNIPLGYFEPSGLSSLQTYLPALAKAKHNILVHNTVSAPEDVSFAKQHPTPLFWCLCPNANLYIENLVPGVAGLFDSGIPLCIGTDSLASNAKLSIISEIESIQVHYPKIPLEHMLTWATYNGARALDIDDRFGSIAKGKMPGINHLVQHSTGLSVQKVC